MGICSYNDSNPVCRCHSDNFELVDKRESRKGCKKKVELRDCPPGKETMLPLEHSIFLTYPPELSLQIYYIAISACMLNCLVGACNAYASTSLSDGSGQCYLKSNNFMSGYHSPAMPSTSYMKVCGPVMPTP
ncbi:G-type lectin S-receptor-like serine/threonine-protein kinase [Forsythia ovata]|uniref:G-type lectin S-receptor-like serine/threonine-protein kinase n=1 Tax=Forsythia ovata TaxID=205694 RepID=A0ABD1X0E2_9LAMI